MRRSLVLTDEAAGHPFLASLAPYIREVSQENSTQHKRWSGKRWSMQDLRDFLLAYCACFIAVSVFIA